jgi:hypothetical protein
VESHSSKLDEVEDRLSGLKDKIDIKEQKNSYSNNLRAVKGLCKNSATPLKYQT